VARTVSTSGSSGMATTVPQRAASAQP
jgi:hypothetical protein